MAESGPNRMKQVMEAFVNFMRTRASMDMPSRKRGQEDEAVDEVEVEAAEEDIEIGRVISAQGDDISLEEAFARIRLTQQGTQNSKEEPAEEKLVDCTQIRYSQHAPQAWRVSKIFQKFPPRGVGKKLLARRPASPIFSQIHVEWL